MNDLRVNNSENNFMGIQPVEKCLNVDKIKDIEDIKRILKFLNIKVVSNGVIESNGFNEVRDLFE